MIEINLIKPKQVSIVLSYHEAFIAFNLARRAGRKAFWLTIKGYKGGPSTYNLYKCKEIEIGKEN